jgi:hypothetical protein
MNHRQRDDAADRMPLIPRRERTGTDICNREKLAISEARDVGRFAGDDATAARAILAAHGEGAIARPAPAAPSRNATPDAAGVKLDELGVALERIFTLKSSRETSSGGGVAAIPSYFGSNTVVLLASVERLSSNYRGSPTCGGPRRYSIGAG